MKKQKVKMLPYTAETQERVRAMMKRKNWTSETTMIMYCINEMHDRIFKDYIEVQKDRLVARSPEEKAAREVNIKEAKEQYIKDKEVSRGKRICEALGGTLSENGMCTYKTYMQVNPKNITVGEVSVEVETLTEDDIKNQYRSFDGKATREEVIKNLNARS